MQVTFYDFTKRTNSTKLVNVQGDTFNHIELKGNCSMLAPVLIIKEVPAAWNPIWNYCRIPAFNRYYFINNWTWLNGVWECSCVCDVLASFKTEIGASEEYIARSSYTFDGTVMDTAYEVKTNAETWATPVPVFFRSQFNSGFYVIGIIGSSSTASQGAVTYYQMTADNMALLREYLLSTTFLQDQGLVGLDGFMPADGIKVIYNPYQYIVSCQWYPFDASVIPAAQKTAVTRIDFGWWDTGAILNAYRLNDNLQSYHRQEDIALRFHPDWQSRGEYLNHAPYTTRVLRMPPFDEIELPSEYFSPLANDMLSISLSVDFITGLSFVTLYAIPSDSTLTTSIMIGRMSAKLSVEIQLAQVGIDYLATSTAMKHGDAALFKTGQNVVNSFDLSHPIKSGVNIGYAITTDLELAKADYVNDFIRSAFGNTLLTSGTNGSLAAFREIATITNTYYIPVPEDNQHIGRPLCRREQISNIPGYIMVRNPDVNIACFNSERAIITQFMASGFYYE